MTSTSKLITTRLAPLEGLEVSNVNHAADMLTLGFGPLRETKNIKGVIKRVSAWAIHVQCDWRLERAGNAIATRDDLRGPDEKAHDTAKRLDETLAGQGLVKVKSIAADDTGGIVISLSGDYRLVVIPDGLEDDEDWRFFAPGVDATHFVIEGGKVAPESFD